MRVGIYARISTGEQQSLSMQVHQLTEYARLRSWTVVLVAEEIASGGLSNRPQQAAVIQAAKQRRIDGILVWKLDRWSRDLGALITSIHDLLEFGVAFISFTETVDFSTIQGRAMAGMLGVFASFEREILKERVKAGLAEARRKGKHLGRPKSMKQHTVDEVKELSGQGLSHLEISKRSGIPRTTVQRILGPSPRKRGYQVPIKSEQHFEGALHFISGFKGLLCTPLKRLALVLQVEASRTKAQKNLPAVTKERVYIGEITTDKPKERWEIEAEEWWAHHWSEEGIREQFPGRNQRLYYNEFGECEEYRKISKYLIEKAKILKRGWTEGTIRKILGSPSFVVYHKYYLPWHFWYKSDVEHEESSSQFATSITRSKAAQQNKLKGDKTKLEKFTLHLKTLRVPIPNLQQAALLKEACDQENKRRPRYKNYSGEWEFEDEEINVNSDKDILYRAADRLLHKKLSQFTKRTLKKFDVAGSSIAKADLYKIIDSAIQQKLISYKIFAHELPT
jgi:DNA invertase Pin-like site-specific DNA recombinase